MGHRVTWSGHMGNSYENDLMNRWTMLLQIQEPWSQVSESRKGGSQDMNLSHIVTNTLFASFTELMFVLITQNVRFYILTHDIISTSASHCPRHVLARNCLLLNVLLGLLTFNVQIVLLFFTLINYEVSRKELSLREKSFVRLFEL